MRIVALAFALALSCPVGAHAAADDNLKKCAAQYKDLNADRRTMTHKTYVTDCMSGKAVPMPEAPAITVPAPIGGPATCRDGTFTSAGNRAGACSEHGGVSGMR